MVLGVGGAQCNQKRQSDRPHSLSPQSHTVTPHTNSARQPRTPLRDCRNVRTADVDRWNASLSLLLFFFSLQAAEGAAASKCCQLVGNDAHQICRFK